MRKVRITSDGTAGGTKIVDIETGEEICGVVDLEITVKSLQPVLARITILAQAELGDVVAVA